MIYLKQKGEIMDLIIMLGVVTLIILVALSKIICCWMFRINEQIALQKEILQALKNLDK